jgi:signal transduction histidine kinase/ActR/RegA family two-component response regulator
VLPPDLGNALTVAAAFEKAVRFIVRRGRRVDAVRCRGCHRDLTFSGDNPTVADAHDLLATIAATLDGLDVAMCVFDHADRTLLWNRAFLRFFPEHAGHVHAGEPYRANLRRFYEGRLDAGEMASIDRYIDEGIERHRGQHRPFTFKHRGSWLQVASLPLSGVGRVRVWSRGVLPRLSDTEGTPALMQSQDVADNTELFEHVGDGVMLTDADNRITWVNEHFVHMFALADKSAAVGAEFEAVYRRVWRADQAADRDLFETGLSTLTENLRFAGAPFDLPLPGTRWFRVIEQRRRDGVGFFALVDISVLKRQQQELIVAERRARESQTLLAEKSRLLEATLERMEQGLMMVNADGVVEVCNRRAIELLGLPAELMASKPTFARVLEYQWSVDDFAHTPEEVQQLMRRGIIDQPQCYDRRRPNGRVIEVQSVPIHGGGMLRTYTDVTERKRAEVTRRVLESQLREAQKLEAIGTLAGGIAHDFNNIMAAILGNAAFAREAVGEGNPAQEYLEQINKAGRRARTLVQQILAFSRKQSNEFVSLALQPLVEETVTMLRSTVGASVRLSAVLPEGSAGVLGNPTQLQQVLMNLGTNAWQALKGAAGHIDVGLEEVMLPEGGRSSQPGGLAPGAYMHLWVRDDGCGMDDETRAHIFEPFFTTKPVGQGTGLGLAVVHGIIEAHGGGIAVESAPGAGSSFHLYLPRIDREGPPMPPETVDAESPRGHGQHVLYVDDDDVMTVMVRGLLQRLGYRATCTLDAREAIAIVAQDPQGVDLVVTDFNMPNCSGLDVARALAGIRPALPVVISSGYISDELRASASALGVFAVLQKEHTLEELGHLIHATLAARRG